MRRAHVTAFVALLAFAGTSTAQNILVNPHFDSSVSGWSFTTPGTFTWDSSLDASSSPTSGSARLANMSPVGYGTSFAAQCVAVTGGSKYDVSVQIRVPSGQVDTGYAMLLVGFLDGASCSGSFVGSLPTPHVTPATTDAWVLVQSVGQAAPATAVSAQAMLWINKVESTGSLVANFDDAVFGPAGTVAAGPFQFYTIAPCRIIDTRAGSGFPAGYGPPSIAGGAQRTFVLAGECGIPADAQAVSANATIWAPVTLGDLRAFPAGSATPTVSMLNWEANILALANAGILQLGAGGAITVQVDGTGTVDLILDVNGYFK